MPPGPVYNWLCVAHSVVDILSIATRIRAEQVAAKTCGPASGALSLKRKRVPVGDKGADSEDVPSFVPTKIEPQHRVDVPIKSHGGSTVSSGQATDRMLLEPQNDIELPVETPQKLGSSGKLAGSPSSEPLLHPRDRTKNDAPFIMDAHSQHVVSDVATPLPLRTTDTPPEVRVLPVANCFYIADLLPPGSASSTSCTSVASFQSAIVPHR